MVDYQPGSVHIQQTQQMTDFDVEISWGTSWVSLDDHLNYRVRAEDFGLKSQTLRRVTATSPYYDGTFLVHSTLENVEEQVGVQVYGASQNQVTENVLALVDYVSQDSYNIRVRMDDHMETWLCEPADYSIDRTHVNAHNIQALVKMNIPRFPKVTYEVIM